MSSVETGQMSAVETGQMSAAEIGQMSSSVLSQHTMLKSQKSQVPQYHNGQVSEVSNVPRAQC